MSVGILRPYTDLTGEQFLLTRVGPLTPTPKSGYLVGGISEERFFEPVALAR